jgi:hypothetical protein
MRFFFRLLLLLLLPAAAAAQSYQRFDDAFDMVVAHDRNQYGPAYGPEDLLPGIPLGIDRQGMIALALEYELQPVDGTREGELYRQDFGDGEMRLRIGFVEDRLHALLVEVRLGDSTVENRELQRITALITLGAQQVGSVDGEKAYYHPTESGVMLRTIVRRNASGNGFAVDVVPAAPDASARPLTEADSAAAVGEGRLDAPQPPVPYDRDMFLPGIEVDMSRADLESWANIGGWASVRRTDRSVEYQTTRSGLLATMDVGFAKEKVRSMKLTVFVSPEYGAPIDAIIDPMLMALEKRARSHRKKGNRLTYLHTTSNGRSVSTEVERMDEGEFTVKSALVK